jgi:hypothetical protein
LTAWIQKNNHLANEDEDDELIETPIDNLLKPKLPIPSPHVFVHHMRIEDQFAYIIPYLEAVLKEAYPPSQDSIDKWMRGGTTRRDVPNSFIGGGGLSEAEWHGFCLLVQKWALSSYEEGDVLFSRPNMIEKGPRQWPRGSQRYELLSQYKRAMVSSSY